MASRHSPNLYRTFLCLPLFWKASLAFAEPVCEWPIGIEKCWDCPPTNPADLTSGSGGYGFGPDGLPCFGDTGPYWDPGPWSNGNPGPSPGGNPSSIRPPTAPTATTSGGPLGPSGSPGPRVFYLTVTWETRAPDGNAREIFVINGQFPGPKLEINQGDDVEIHLINQSPFNTTIHFHGGFLNHSPSQWQWHRLTVSCRNRTISYPMVRRRTRDLSARCSAWRDVHLQMEGNSIRFLLVSFTPNESNR